MKKLIPVIMALFTAVTAQAMTLELKSPDGKLVVQVETGAGVYYTLSHGGDRILYKSPVAMHMTDGTVFGGNESLSKINRRSVRQSFEAALYKKSEVKDEFNEMTLNFKKYMLIFRAYNEGMAYRFVSKIGKSYEVENEVAEFNFAKDWNMWAAYVSQNTGSIETQFFNSHESQYTYTPISQWNKERIAFLPLMIDGPAGKKVVISESDLMDYPGMFLYNGKGAKGLSAVFAKRPSKVRQGGHNNLQMLVEETEDYISANKGKVSFPWRIISISEKDAQMADNDMVYRLASPSDPNIDWSWILPGKVAWEWWNDWNLKDVTFKPGVNTETYKYYIDFACKYGIEYVILDEGWSVNGEADLFKVVPEIDLAELIDYAEKRSVGIILWAGYQAFDRDMEAVCRHYSQMGVKGFKIDFMDRADQYVVNFHKRAAETAARYRMVVDFHGTYKPTGLNRTYPNVLNYEGVFGLENMKWCSPEVDQMEYDVTVPYIRMMAGPMDYTQGAMKNAARDAYRPDNHEPMSQGTRCHQLGAYIVFESPLNMLCDTPSHYLQEKESTSFIAAVPTVWDETVALDGKVGDYIAMARRADNVWYVGAMTDWNERTIELDLGFLPAGDYEMEVFKDGPSAHVTATDYVRETVKVPADRKVQVKMAPGGGYAARITKVTRK
ncbi:MAG: glycoside hydrolase family 97 protein [Bacteroidales bacterium]|nr:glycoside hydrolase family 97 protein [Bacteroidales bacterium]